MKIMFSAGEASGDTHGASVAKALSQIDSNIEMFGMGGTLMEFEVSRDAYGWVHDPLLLGSALKQTFESLGA